MGVEFTGDVSIVEHVQLHQRCLSRIKTSSQMNVKRSWGGLDIIYLNYKDAERMRPNKFALAQMFSEINIFSTHISFMRRVTALDLLPSY